MWPWHPANPTTLPNSLTLAGREIPLDVTRHARAKRMTLRFDSQRRVVRLSLPPRASQKLAARFLQEKRHWLEAQVTSAPLAVPYRHGMVLPVLGDELTLHHTETERTRIRRLENTLQVETATRHLSAKLEDWLKKEFRATALEDAYDYAQALGVTFKRLSVREATSRWGSCSTSGTISLNWRLVFAPTDVRRYVVAHEIAHIEAMHHGPEFWQLVERVHPEYKAHRKWLHQHAARLHAYGKAA